MLRQIDLFKPIFKEKNVELQCPDVVQTLSEEELLDLVPAVDGWIIGDDPATRTVFEAGKKGKLKAAVKWGIGVDNVDFQACKDLNIPIINTPNMFGEEVACIALNYITGLARQTFFIDREVRIGNWPKPAGMSLRDKVVALIGFGDIGKATAHFLYALGMKINVYDPYAKCSDEELAKYKFHKWPEKTELADFIVSTCALTKETHHMINDKVLSACKPGVKVVNVSRGPVHDELALLKHLATGQVSAAALDVFENEPLAADHPLRKYDQCIFGTHNGSNTREGVVRASHKAIEELFGFLNIT